MEKELNCLRCGHKMNLMKQEHLFLGKVGLEWGDAHYTTDHGFQVDIYCCPECGKLEFYRENQAQTRPGADSGIARTQCSRCGTVYEMDDPKCPCCGAKNSMLY